MKKEEKTKDVFPLAEYFRSLKGRWDKRNHIKEYAKQVKTIDVTWNDFTAILSSWMVDTIKCCLEDGFINDRAIILSGPQGIGKDQWINGLLADNYLIKDLDSTFHSYVDLSFAKANPHIVDTCIITFQEFIETDAPNLIQNLVTASIRLPYQRENTRRKASFIGSSDVKVNVPNPHKRLIIIKTKEITYVRPNIEQLWAQAVWLYFRQSRFESDLEVLT